MRWLDSVIEATNMNLTQVREAVEDSRAWCALVQGVTKSWTQLNDDGSSSTTYYAEEQDFSY